MLTLEGGNGRPPGVELRPACVLAVRQSGRKPLGDVPDPLAGVKAVISPARWADYACLQAREGGIQAQGRGWAPSIWEISDNLNFDAGSSGS
jgi:hypothetical protein